MSMFSIKKSISFLSCILLILTIVNCSGDSEEPAVPEVSKPSILLSGGVTPFIATDVLSFSESKTIEVKGENLTGNLKIVASENFEISKDNNSFSSQIEITETQANAENNIIYVRFAPKESALGNVNGKLTFTSNQASEQSINLRGEGISIAPIININKTSLNFEDTEIMTESSSLNLAVNGGNLVTGLDLSVTAGFVISLDDITFTNTLQIPAALANNDTVVYVRFTPNEVGSITGILAFQNAEIDDIEMDLVGVGISVTHKYTTFNKQILAPTNATQKNEQNFTLHNNLSNVSKITMYVKLECEAGGCPPWDVFGNVLVHDAESDSYYELGRFITPYGKSTSQLIRGFKYDVTDFKSMLQGSVELRARIETWSKRWLITVEFDYEEGTPDFPYYAISNVFDYNFGPQVIPYGKSHKKDLTRTITIPTNAESTHLRSVITGWGHATPVDADNRPCAEWCYRTHDVKIDNANTFSHYMGPIGCANNPIAPQGGNWSPDRAGWCPGMGVPIRTDTFSANQAGKTFALEYDFQDWTTDGGTTSGQNGAFYSLSQFVVVKSNTEIVKPAVVK